jgi:hypothetical protein
MKKKHLFLFALPSALADGWLSPLSLGFSPTTSLLIGLKPGFYRIPIRQLKLTAILKRNFFFLFVS